VHNAGVEFDLAEDVGNPAGADAMVLRVVLDAPNRCDGGIHRRPAGAKSRDRGGEAHARVGASEHDRDNHTHTLAHGASWQRRRTTISAVAETVSSGVHDKPEALVLKADELAHRSRDEHSARNQMCLELPDDLLGSLLVCVLFTGGDLTGLPMKRLVSYEEQHAAALEALDAYVRVVRVGSIVRRLAGRRVFAGEPLIARCRLPSTWILDLVDLAEAVFSPDAIVVHRQVRCKERL